MRPILRNRDPRSRSATIKLTHYRRSRRRDLSRLWHSRCPRHAEAGSGRRSSLRDCRTTIHAPCSARPAMIVATMTSGHEPIGMPRHPRAASQMAMETRNGGSAHPLGTGSRESRHPMYWLGRHSSKPVMGYRPCGGMDPGAHLDSGDHQCCERYWPHPRI